MDRGIYFKNSKLKLSPINACSQSKIADKQLIVQIFIKSSKKQIPMPVRPYTKILTLYFKT
ncbi:hypothetical protein UT300005_11080 [Clostridium sp. CTA-5]